MIAEDQIQEFEALKRQIYDLFKETISEDIWSDFGDIEKISFIAIDDSLAIHIEGDVAHADWFTEDIKNKLVDLLLPLKRISLDETYGAWLSCEIVIDHQHDRANFLFNYDEFLTGRMEKYTPQNYRNELMFFPRKPEGIPEWMKTILGSKNTNS